MDIFSFSSWLRSVITVFHLLVVSVTVTTTEGMTTSLTWTSQSLSGLTWNMPRPVMGYQSYMDVYPTRYDVPIGLSQMTWAFQTLPSKSCGNVTVYFMIQQGSLPLVKQGNQSLPDNYVVPSVPLLRFEMLLGQIGSFTLLQPRPGSWYVIAYSKDVDTKIRQKGLSSSDNCLINYMSSLQLGPKLQRQYVSLYDLHTVTISGGKSLLSFGLPISSFGFKVNVKDCLSANCSITLSYQPLNMHEELSKDCEAFPCYFHVPSPLLGEEESIYIRTKSLEDVTLELQISSFTCRYFSTSGCNALPPLARINTPTPNFSSLGFVYFKTASLTIELSKINVMVIPFNIIEPNDVGATLNWRMHISPYHTPLDKVMVRVCGGLVHKHLPDLRDKEFNTCLNLSKSVQITKLGSQSNESIMYVPYPNVGIWHIILQATCFLVENGTTIPCPTSTSVDMALDIKPCIDDGCGGKGQCLFRTLGSDLITYTACRCYADYRGYGCEDNSHALSYSVQLAGALLLTMSNLLFIPAIVLALRGRFFVEAFVYSYTMFFSTFYHACDGDRIDKFRLCIMDFDVLQAADFFGSSCSVWFTLVAMAMIRIRYLTPVLQVLGPFGLFIGVLYDKTSLYIIAAPIIAGLLTVIISWGIKMYRRKKLYPSKKRYLFFLLPGITLATVAAVIYSYIETQSNYKYIHSMWHICIALSVSFLLPPRNAHLKDKDQADIMTTPLAFINMENGNETDTH